MSEAPIDLTSAEVTLRLLRDPSAWRERAVETLRVNSAQFVARERSLQCRPLFPILRDMSGVGARPSAEAFVVLPLGLLPKQPLLRFDVTGPIGSPVLLRREQIADREAMLVRHYAEEACVAAGPAVTKLLPVLLGFTEGSWAAVKAGLSRRQDAMVEYLRAGLNQAPSDELVAELRAASERARAVLDPYNEAADEATSAPEMPFLAVPLLVANGYVDNLDDAMAAIVAYADLVSTASHFVDFQTPNSANALLNVLADYGRHWELMVLAQVPLNRPFTLTYWHLDHVRVQGRLRARITPAVVIADADSNHVVLSIDDPSSRLLKVEGRHPRTRELARMGSTSRQTEEVRAFYVWENDVDFRVVLDASLGVLRRIVVANLLMLVIVVLVTLALALRAPTSTGELAVAAGPTAAVASLLLLREPSTLASRLRLPLSLMVVLSVLVLVGVAVWRFTTLP